VMVHMLFRHRHEARAVYQRRVGRSQYESGRSGSFLCSFLHPLTLPTD
jgi:hypothetical protein